MKLLVVGLDGTDLSLIKHFDMPFTQRLVEDRVVVPVAEDLWSRGWVKILSGLPSTTTGAFYQQPSLNGQVEFTQAYSTRHYPRDEGKLPLWEELDRAGVRSAFFNLPTTMPAPEVNGFLLSGAGGGISPGARIPPIACHPRSMQDELVQRRMIWEHRFVESGVRSTDLYCLRCIDAVWRRTESFCELVANYGSIDFGFIAHKEPVLITNIFMHDIQALMDGRRPSNAVHRLMRRFFENLDDTIALAVNRLQPEHVALVSDHGSAPYRRSLNFNAILEDLDHLQFEAPRKPGPDERSLRHKARDRLSATLKPQIVENRGPQRFPARRRIDFSGTRAFSHFYIPGIYLYDPRFGGPDIGGAESSSLVDRICRQFNEHPASTQAGLTATPFRRQHLGARAEALLPDIWIDHPEDCFPEQRGLAVQPNPYFRTWDDLSLLDRDIAGGKKNNRAMCVVEPAYLGEVDPTRGDLDLTAAHELILNHFR